MEPTMTPDWRVVTTATGVEWRGIETDRLLALLARPLPYNARYALAGEALVACGAVPLVEGVPPAREPWLTAAVRSAAAFADGPPAGSDGAGELLEMLRWLANGKGWKALDAVGPTLRFAIPGAHDLPPLALAAHGTGVRVERPLPLLPARDAVAQVRAAVAHAVLVLNGTPGGARIALRDPRALTIAVETDLPADGVEEDEAECVLDAVCRAAPRAAGVLECLRHPAVAHVYAIAQASPDAPPDRERTKEE
jgi:hypothetical protein